MNADVIPLSNLQEKRTAANENQLRRDSSKEQSSLDCCSGMKRRGSVFRYKSSERTNNITISFKNKAETHSAINTENNVVNNEYNDRDIQVNNHESKLKSNVKLIKHNNTRIQIKTFVNK